METRSAVHLVVGVVSALFIASCSSENSSLDGASSGGFSSGGSSPSGASSSGGSSSGESSSGGSSSGGSSGGGSSSGGSSSGGSSSGDGGNDAGGADASNCINGVPSPGSGHHNAGDDCLSCHKSLNASVRWTIAGTLYSAATGGKAVSGATIEVTDASGKVLELPTYTNGNFYTTTAVSFPLKVRASRCPSDMAMTGTVPQGSCNASGCHTSAMRIYLP